MENINSQESCDLFWSKFICFNLQIIMEDCANNSSKEAMTEGLVGLLRPAVEEVDERVKAVRLIDNSDSSIIAHCLCL